MSGRPGRSGGWNRISPEEHARRGTKPRHQPAPALKVAEVPIRDPIPDAVLRGLDAPGRDFVLEAWAHFSGWGPASLTLLRQAGLLLDELETRQGQPGARASQRLLVTILRELRLDL